MAKCLGKAIRVSIEVQVRSMSIPSALYYIFTSFVLFVGLELDSRRPLLVDLARQKYSFEDFNQPIFTLVFPLFSEPVDNDGDNCYTKPCGPGVCEDLLNSYRCICPPNYNGTHCENDLASK